MERETPGKLEIGKGIKVTIRVSIYYYHFSACLTLISSILPEGSSGAFEPWISEWASGLRLTCAGEAKLLYFLH